MELIFLSAWRRRRRPKRKVLLGKNDSTEIDDGKITSPHFFVCLFNYFWSIGYLWISEIDPNRLVRVWLPFSLSSAFKKSSSRWWKPHGVTRCHNLLFLVVSFSCEKSTSHAGRFGTLWLELDGCQGNHGKARHGTTSHMDVRDVRDLRSVDLHPWPGFCERALPKLLRGVTLIILHILQYWMMRCSGSYRLSAIHCLIIAGDLDCKSLPRFDELRNEWHPSILETRESLLRRILFTSFDPLGRYLDSYGIGTVGCAFTSAHHHKMGSDRSINPSWSSKRNGDTVISKDIRFGTTFGKHCRQLLTSVRCGKLPAPGTPRSSDLVWWGDGMSWGEANWNVFERGWTLKQLCSFSYSAIGLKLHFSHRCISASHLFVVFLFRYNYSKTPDSPVCDPVQGEYISSDIFTT